jgi:hypothetical protein
MRPALEIRGLDPMRKRFAGLGAVKNLGPALRVEAEAVADAARERLREQDPKNLLAQSIKIMELEAGDHPAFAVGTNLPACCPKGDRGGFESVGQGLIMGEQVFALKRQSRHPLWLTVVDGDLR